MAIFIFILGTIFGSFFLVLGTRLPLKENIWTTRSRCDHCHKTLKWYNLVPLLSFIVQRGRCQNCHQKISKEHFFVELLSGGLFLFTYLYFPIGYNFYAGLIIVSLMIIIFISDLKYMIILDSPLVFSIIAICILKYIYFGASNCLISLLSGLCMFLTMYFISKFGHFLLKKESLGGGDIKLSFVIGLILGYKMAMVSLVLSTFIALPYAVGSLYLKESHEFAYGPFLVGALFIVFYNLEKFNNLFFFLFHF